MACQEFSVTYLQKDLSEYAVRFLPEDCRKDDGNTVSGSLHINGFLIAIMYLHQIALSAARCLKILLILESEFERCC